MMESIFVLMFLISIGLIAVAFGKKDATVLMLGAMLLSGTGLLLLESQPGTGVEETVGFNVRALGDDNFDIDFNKFYRNAGNDTSFNILGNMFFWGGIAGLVFSLAFLMQGAVRERRLK